MIVTLAAAVIILPLLLVGLRAKWNVGYDAPDRRFTLFEPELIFVNAPEGTAYIDPLVRLDVDDEHYIDFSEPPQTAVIVSEEEYDDGRGWEWRALNVDENSEITRLRRDGFVSLSQHYSPRVVIMLDIDARISLYLNSMYSESIDRIFEIYGGFRAAYVDKDGNVLGVTEPAVRVYDNEMPTAFIADGNTLTFRVHGIPAWQSTILYSITTAEFVLIAALFAAALAAIMRKLFSDREKIDRLA